MIKFINQSNVENIVSENISYFDLYLRTGYRKYLNKKILYEKDIDNFKDDFLYVCLDLLWKPEISTYSKELYDCYPKSINTNKFKIVSEL